MRRLILDLEELASNGRPGLTRAEAGHLAEAAAVAIDATGKSLPQVVSISGRKRRKPHLIGPQVTPQMRRTYGDLQEAVEWGAQGVAASAIEVLEGLTVYERSPKSGFGFDYFLVPKDQVESEDELNFFAQATHVLEVSGTLQTDDRELDNRTDEKIHRLKSRPQMLPAFVVVVDFHRIRAKVVKYG